MKEIIYLDTGFIHSFVAQTNQGLPTLITNEITEQDTTAQGEGRESESEHNITAGAKGGVPLVVSGEANYKNRNKNKLSDSYTFTQLEAGKEIISKQLHDNALVELEKYLSEKNELFCSKERPVMGKYIILKEKFSLFDLNTLLKLYDKETIKEILSLMNPTNQNGKKAKLQPGPEKGLISLNIVIKYLYNILPSGSCLKQGDFISPLKVEYLRETIGDLIFKYGNQSQLEICVLGKVTQVFDKISLSMFENNSAFSEVASSTDQMLEALLGEVKLIKKGDIILSPIAIYFE
ncbi:DUF6414 family protein [Brevibacillus laterosporus]|uniref:DUF6414 family protein n=1 Tax=Brevibacillus laterosporus TaxID=1465 RepID=UPI001EF1FC4C|nr:hypothetical protein [Brevibacillus laterosporus]MCG7318684.1 hypothetical protein [Brevibacillus laterosporus]